MFDALITDILDRDGEGHRLQLFGRHDVNVWCIGLHPHEQRAGSGQEENCDNDNFQRHM